MKVANRRGASRGGCCNESGRPVASAAPSPSISGANFMTEPTSAAAPLAYASPPQEPGRDTVQDYKIWQVIAASAAGTVIEWYDFYIFGALATVISSQFYPPGNDLLALINYLSAFAVGFIVR